MSAFIRLLWSGRTRRKPNQAFQERAAWYTLHPARNVQATPRKPPLKDKRDA